MKYELKIIIDTNNINEFVNSLVEYCHSHKNSIDDNEIECPFWYTGCPFKNTIACSSVSSKEWKQVLKLIK